jgi:starch synthase
MRYGTVPIVRKTGGLSDTVFDIDHSPKPINERNGLVFEYPTLDSMDYIINRAFNLFKNEKETWNRVMKSCLSYDFSFKKAADQYLAIYRSI